jgi:hypothetical protein
MRRNIARETEVCKPPLHLNGCCPDGTFCIDILDRLLGRTPIGLIVGADAMKFDGWQRLNAEYAKQFGIEIPNGTGEASAWMVYSAIASSLFVVAYRPAQVRTAICHRRSLRS